MLKSLFQEISDFKEFGSCLERPLYEVYKTYLEKKLIRSLKETTVKNLADIFRRIFSQEESQTPKATLLEINRLMKAMQQTKYERKFKKTVPNGRTNLEIKPGEYCNKETFRKEFEKENFDEFENKEDISIKDAVKVFLDRYLELYNENGLLISKANSSYKS